MTPTIPPSTRHGVVRHTLSSLSFLLRRVLRHFLLELHAISQTLESVQRFTFSPLAQWNSINGATEYEVVVTEIGQREALRRDRVSENSLSIFGVRLETHDIWVRALGTGVAKSRWVKISDEVFQ